MSLRPQTQKGYRNIVKRMQMEPFADALLTDFEPRFIRKIVARLGDRPAAANRWLSLFRIMFQFALDDELVSADPTIGVRRLKERGEGSKSWSEEEIAQFEGRWAQGTRPRLAFALMLYTGQRRSDVVRMGPAHIKNGMIALTQQKTNTSLLVPIHASLADILALVPDDMETFLETQSGSAASSNGLGNQFRDWVAAAGLPDTLSGHGLRKAAARRLAESGCSTHQIAAITGHKTLAEVERYTRAVDQERLAREAMERMAFVKLNVGSVKPS